MQSVSMICQWRRAAALCTTSAVSKQQTAAAHSYLHSLNPLAQEAIMLQSNVSSNSFSSRHLFAAAAAAPAVMAEERLPFTIRLVREEQDVRKAVSVRHAAYAKCIQPTGRLSSNCDCRFRNYVDVSRARQRRMPRPPVAPATGRVPAQCRPQPVDPGWPKAPCLRCGTAAARRLQRANRWHASRPAPAFSGRRTPW